MVDVPVGEPDGAERPGPGVSSARNIAGSSRIDDHRLTGPPVRHEIAVLGELPVGQRDDLKSDMP
jgi:hypothetical protein